MALHKVYMARYLAVDVPTLTSWIGVSAPEVAAALGKSSVDLNKAVAYADFHSGEAGPSPFPPTYSSDAPFFEGGTVDEVLMWVDGDPARAQVALADEVSGKNRSTLVSSLEAIIG